MGNLQVLGFSSCGWISSDITATLNIIAFRIDLLTLDRNF